MSKQTPNPADQICNPTRGPTASAKRGVIHAKNIMTTEVVMIGPDKTIREIAVLLNERHISAVPVTENGRIIGIVSEGDLIRREELGTDQSVSRRNVPGANFDIAKSHGVCARDVMSPDVVTLSEQASLADVVEILQANRIKRVLVMRDEKLVGIVSRSDIVRALAARPSGAHEPLDSDDDIIRYRVIETLLGIPGTSPWLTSVSVSSGVVELRGTLEDETKYEVSRNAVANIPQVVEVRDYRGTLQPYGG